MSWFGKGEQRSELPPQGFIAFQLTASNAAEQRYSHQVETICDTSFPESTTAFSMYSRVHISSDTAFFKILKEPSIVQK